MENLYFRVITIVMGLYFTETMTNPPRKGRILFNSECQWEEHLTNCSLTMKYNGPSDVSRTAATLDVSCSSLRVLLQSHTEKGRKVKHPGLVSSLLSGISSSALALLHASDTLDLSGSAIRSLALHCPSPGSSWVQHHRGSFGNGIPFLKALILQSNKLSNTPEGLWHLKSLRSLDLSFNEILRIGLSDFHNCRHLERLSLKGNKIFRIHPEAFKDLKNLQVVDLSGNALTTILPMVTLALEHPHLEVNLADNPWQCDNWTAIFQSFTSGSWRRKWSVLCNTLVENEEVSWAAPGSRTSREPHRPQIHRNHLTDSRSRQAGRPQEGPRRHVATLRTTVVADSGPGERQTWRGRAVRQAQDVGAAGRRDSAGRDSLALAVCLSVFVTFLAAFCLGAFCRPYIDRLWGQGCQDHSPHAGAGHFNEGFYDDVEVAGNRQPPRSDQPRVFHDPHLYESQDSFSVTEPWPQAAVTPEGTLGSSQQSLGQHGNPTRATSGVDATLPKDSAASPLSDDNDDHTYSQVVLRGLNRDAVDGEGPISERPAGPSHRGPGWSELDAPLSGETPAPLSEKQTYANTQGTAENKDTRATGWLPWAPAGPQVQVTREMQGRTVEGLPSMQGTLGTGAEALCPAHGSEVPGGTDPGPSGNPNATSADEGPGTLSDFQCVRVSRHHSDSDSDSDEGSLFTLSSSNSEDAGTGLGTEGEEPQEDATSGGSQNRAVPFRSPEGSITFQKILQKGEKPEDLISGPDSALCETQVQNVPDTWTPEEPEALPGSARTSLVGDQIPGTATYEDDTAQPETPPWHCSLRDLEWFSEDISARTPPCHADVEPSDPDGSASQGRDVGVSE
ncbi:leucine-rich repeat-containing protein 66 isoform X2 [Tupaia chinensis]|nr:leucine-rich repeat-containing protein 66 isoform X2 [Tupaia chinensis]